MYLKKYFCLFVWRDIYFLCLILFILQQILYKLQYYNSTDDFPHMGYEIILKLSKNTDKKIIFVEMTKSWELQSSFTAPPNLFML